MKAVTSARLTRQTAATLQSVVTDGAPLVITRFGKPIVLLIPAPPAKPQTSEAVK